MGIGQVACKTVNLQQCKPIEVSPDSNFSRGISVGLGHGSVHQRQREGANNRLACAFPRGTGEGTRGQAAWERRGGLLMGIGQVAHETVNLQQCKPIEVSPDSNFSRGISMGLGRWHLLLLNIRPFLLLLFKVTEEIHSGLGMLGWVIQPKRSLRRGRMERRREETRDFRRGDFAFSLGWGFRCGRIMSQIRTRAPQP